MANRRSTKPETKPEELQETPETEAAPVEETPAEAAPVRYVVDEPQNLYLRENPGGDPVTILKNGTEVEAYRRDHH